MGANVNDVERFENVVNGAVCGDVDAVRPIDLDIDEGNLLVFDQNEFDLKVFTERKESIFKQCSQDCVQALLNKLYQLPRKEVDQTFVVELPAPSSWLPREKVIPKEKSLTKWEKFAKLKGIHKKKKGRMSWDDTNQKWRPSFGYKSKDKSWLLEVPQNADPNEDQFEKKRKEKMERVSKNEMQRLRNIARVTKRKVPGVGLTPLDKPTRDDLSRALSVTHRSTASLGKFMPTLPKEKVKGLGKKRKFEALDVDDQEKQRKIMKQVIEQPVLNVSRAANLLQNKQEVERSGQKDGNDKKKSFGGKNQKSKRAGYKGQVHKASNKKGAISARSKSGGKNDYGGHKKGKMRKK